MKHGVIELMRSLAVELGPEGLRITAVCPAGTRTPMLISQFADDFFGGVPFGSGLGQPHLVENGLRTQTMMPVGYMKTEDIANAVTWLLSGHRPLRDRVRSADRRRRAGRDIPVKDPRSDEARQLRRGRARISCTLRVPEEGGQYDAGRNGCGA